jgi:hypothetical protein
MFNHLLVARIRLIILSGMALLVLSVVPTAQSTTPHLGYGFNVADWDMPRLQAMGFNWMKIFDVPTSPLPVKVLVRVEANAQTSVNDVLNDLDLKLVYKANIQAWEIGNEVNIRGNADYGWNGTPDVAAYKALLCAAYARIKSQSPTAIVVSAGLAPAGRLTNDNQIDEREFVQQLLDMGGGACLDAVGFHPYGYSADYDTAPDVASGDPTQNCEQGFCFRGAEKIYEIMQAHGAGDKKMWATEFGWITQPPDHCLADGSWDGRQWQIVSNEKQASNLAGAFQYADDHWPWMGAMFIFNLNFYAAPWYTNECEQMLWYSVRAGSPAESALTGLVKNPADLPRRLTVGTDAINLMIAQSWQPITQTVKFPVTNCCAQSLTYSITLEAGSTVIPDIFNGTNTLAGFGQRNVHVHVGSFDRTPGVYTSTLTFTVTPASLGGLPQSIPLQLIVVDHIYQVHLPTVLR